MRETRVQPHPFPSASCSQFPDYTRARASEGACAQTPARPLVRPRLAVGPPYGGCAVIPSRARKQGLGAQKPGLPEPKPRFCTSRRCLDFRASRSSVTYVRHSFVPCLGAQALSCICPYKCPILCPMRERTGLSSLCVSCFMSALRVTSLGNLVAMVIVMVTTVVPATAIGQFSGSGAFQWKRGGKVTEMIWFWTYQVWVPLEFPGRGSH